jgi:tagatose-1,6-bisphosphate aldolase non-catalytic subunit AgaZ/GatZ
VHDPTFSSEALVDLGSEAAAKPPMFIFAVGAIIAMVVAIVVVLLVLMEKKPGQKIQQSYERTMSSQPGEWAKYYNKK